MRLAAWLGLLALATCSRREVTDAETPATTAEPSAARPPDGPEPRTAGSASAPAFGERVAERRRMVERDIAREGVRDPRVLEAMRKVPRHAFVPEAMRAQAYSDRPLPIVGGQTISQPFVVAFMSEAVAIQPGARCLEIGTGSGYQAAVLAELCGAVYSIEYLPEVAAFGRENLERLGYASDRPDTRVHLRVGDGYQGWPEAAPFDAIVVTAAPEKVPQPLLDQLAPKGRLVIPVGPEYGPQKLELWTRRDDGSFERKELANVAFVPFLGRD